jgi:hypothetical protein
MSAQTTGLSLEKLLGVPWYPLCLLAMELGEPSDQLMERNLVPLSDLALAQGWDQPMEKEWIQ